jgi:hypothetical protein
MVCLVLLVNHVRIDAEWAFTPSVGGSYGRTAADGVGNWRRLPDCRTDSKVGSSANSEAILRADRFAGTDSPSGTIAQIPGAVSLHCTMLFGFILLDYAPTAANRIWGVHPI